MGSRPEKYYKRFDFFYKRTCFRLMSEFFKHIFQPFQRQWLEEKKATDMEEVLTCFMKQHFSKICSKLSRPDQEQLRAYMTVMVHSHRHNKNE